MFQVHVVLKDLVRKSIGETEVASFFFFFCTALSLSVLCQLNIILSVLLCFSN
jgi:hypothetical protein